MTGCPRLCTKVMVELRIWTQNWLHLISAKHCSRCWDGLVIGQAYDLDTRLYLDAGMAWSRCWDGWSRCWDGLVWMLGWPGQSYGVSVLFSFHEDATVTFIKMIINEKNIFYQVPTIYWGIGPGIFQALSTVFKVCLVK